MDNSEDILLTTVTMLQWFHDNRLTADERTGLLKDNGEHVVRIVVAQDEWDGEIPFKELCRAAQLAEDIINVPQEQKMYRCENMQGELHVVMDAQLFLALAGEEDGEGLDMLDLDFN